MQNVLETDGVLAAGEISLETARAIEEGGPWGQAFPEPVFDGEFDVVEARTVGDRHLKLWLRAAVAMQPIEAIAFGYFDEPEARRPARARSSRSPTACSRRRSAARRTRSCWWSTWQGTKGTHPFNACKRVHFTPLSVKGVRPLCSRLVRCRRHGIRTDTPADRGPHGAPEGAEGVPLSTTPSANASKS